jgi:hypothetical protein
VPHRDLPPTVILLSPYAGDVTAHTQYARACMADALSRGEAPFAPHLLYTQPGVLDDADPTERKQGIRCGLAWATRADHAAVYVDHGISPGMQQELSRLARAGVPVEVRALDIRTRTAAERLHIDQLLDEAAQETSELRVQGPDPDPTDPDPAPPDPPREAPPQPA